MSPPVTAQAPRPSLLFYTHGLVDGGGERLWACLATAFHQRGYRVLFVQDFEASENRDNLDPDIPVYTVGRDKLGAISRLTQILDYERPDVTLSAIGGSNLKLIAALARSRSPSRAIITYHGFNEWKTGALSCLAYLGLPFLSRRAALTVGVSLGLRDTLVRRWGSDPTSTICIHNPVFFPQAAEVPEATELAEREEIILAVGRFVTEKDFLTLLRAFARLDRPSARLVIIGKGPLQTQMVTEIARLGLTGRVSLPGYSKEPWKYYATAKCFVSSSVSEPFGNVVVEAMAYGLPVVATACDGPLEILENGRFGRIVPLGDPMQMAHAINLTLDEPGDPVARRRRAEDFSFAVRVPDYERVINEVLAAPGSAVRQSQRPGLSSERTAE